MSALRVSFMSSLRVKEMKNIENGRKTYRDEKVRFAKRWAFSWKINVLMKDKCVRQPVKTECVWGLPGWKPTCERGFAVTVIRVCTGSREGIHFRMALSLISV